MHSCDRWKSRRPDQTPVTTVTGRRRAPIDHDLPTIAGIISAALVTVSTLPMPVKPGQHRPDARLVRLV
jgi:hypothetical protein